MHTDIPHTVTQIYILIHTLQTHPGTRRGSTAFLYKMRRDIEKLFDEKKNKLTSIP
jgi:hypothetical protein